MSPIKMTTHAGLGALVGRGALVFLFVFVFLKNLFCFLLYFTYSIYRQGEQTFMLFISLG